MDTVTITNPKDQRFPFGKELWNGPQVVYHGTWSTYSPRIESGGFVHAELPFNHADIATVMRAWEAVGILNSYAKEVFFAGTPGPRSELSMTASFWHARAYATDGGGEVVRMMLKEAKDFEALCLQNERRLALKGRWEEGLKKSPGHRLTLNAVALLGNQEALQALCNGVKMAREAIEKVRMDGCPVVYAIRVKPEWFPDTWERYMFNWKEGTRAAVELRCNRNLLFSDRILAKAIYPNGTDADFLLDGFKTWTEVEALSSSE
jgi:hypothetical protein